VHADDLFGRVAQALGDRKAGSRIVARLDEVSRAGHRNGRWVYRNHYFFRRDGKVDVRSRAATGIPGERVASEEYQAAVRDVLAEIGPCSEDELVVGVRTLLGFNRTGAKLQTRIDEAIRLLIDDGVVGHAANGLGLRDER